MKKFFLVIIISLLLFLSFCLGLYVQETVDNKKINQLKIQINNNLKEENNIKPENQYNNTIDIEENNCISISDVYHYPLCSQKAEKAWDNEIQKNLELLKKVMTKEDFKYIIEMNQNWDKTLNLQIANINRFISNKDGIIYQTEGAEDIVSLKKQYALFLNNIYSNYVEENNSF